MTLGDLKQLMRGRQAPQPAVTAPPPPPPEPERVEVPVWKDPPLNPVSPGGGRVTWADRSRGLTTGNRTSQLQRPSNNWAKLKKGATSTGLGHKQGSSNNWPKLRKGSTSNGTEHKQGSSNNWAKLRKGTTSNGTGHKQGLSNNWGTLVQGSNWDNLANNLANCQLGSAQDQQPNYQAQNTEPFEFMW